MGAASLPDTPKHCQPLALASPMPLENTSLIGVAILRCPTGSVQNTPRPKIIPRTRHGNCCATFLAISIFTFTPLADFSGGSEVGAH